MTEPTPTKRAKRPNPDQPVIAQVMAALGETAGQAEAQIRRMVRTVGRERTLAFLAQTEEVEANGGMLLPDGSRRRTKGGVFFRLARDQVTPAQRTQIFSPWNRRKPRRPPAADPPAAR
jgi:phosphorylated adapter RNA export protein